MRKETKERIINALDVAIEQAKGFCPTGDGGGIDNSCGRGGGGSGTVSGEKISQDDVLAIAKKHFFVETLEERKMDSLDFHEINRGSARGAMEDAYKLAGGKGSYEKSKSVRTKFAAIAKEELFIDSLDDTNSGDDFFEAGVWGMRAVIEKAYAFGRSKK